MTRKDEQVETKRWTLGLTDVDHVRIEHVWQRFGVASVVEKVGGG